MILLVGLKKLNQKSGFYTHNHKHIHIYFTYYV